MGVGAQAGLLAREGERPDAQRVDRHRQEGHRYPLARGQEDVHFARRGLVGDLVGQIDELVGRVPHGRHDDDDVVARLPGLHDPAGDAFDGGGVRDGRTTEFLDD